MAGEAISSKRVLNKGALNALVSNSRQWNPGDEFILAGVRNLLEPIVGKRINWALWNRNPDLFVDRWKQPIFRPSILSNCAVEPTLDIHDLVVLAGTPEWFGPVVERIYRELLRYPEVPLLAMGIGGCGPGFRFSPVELEVFNRSNTVVICRNPSLAQDMNEQLSTPKAIVLPCPAFFSSRETQPRSAQSFESTPRVIGIQGDAVENQSLPPESKKAFDETFIHQTDASGYRYAAHYIDEFVSYSRSAVRDSVFYSYEQADYAQFFRNETRALVTARLHGAIAALSCGTPARLVQFGSARVNDACIPFGDLLSSMPIQEAKAWIDTTSPETLAAESAALMALKAETRERYHSLLRSFISQQAPHLFASEIAASEVPASEILATHDYADTRRANSDISAAEGRV